MRTQIRQLLGKRADVPGVAAFVGRVVTTGASMSHHDDAVLGERPEEFDDAGIGKRELLEERVQLYPADAVVAQRGEVLLDTAGLGGPSRRVRTATGRRPPMNPLVPATCRGDVGDRQAAREVDTRAVHRGAQPVEGPVADRRQADRARAASTRGRYGPARHERARR